VKVGNDCDAKAMETKEDTAKKKALEREDNVKRNLQ